MTPAFVPNMMPAIPELFLACAGMVLLMIGVFTGRGALRAVSIGVIASLTATAILVYLNSGVVELGAISTFNEMMIIDGFGNGAKIIVLIGGILGTVLSVNYLEREGFDRFEYPILILFSVLGMMLMISSNDFITFYLGLELQNLSLYVLAAIRRNTVKSSEAGLKYFVLGALSSGMLLYGASMVYGYTGSTNFDMIATVISAGDVDIGLTIGLVFVLTSLAFKVSAVPFHMWTPDVYEGVATSVTAFFSMVPKLAAAALTLRVLSGPFAEVADQWQQIVVVLAIGTLAVGALAGLRQTNIKRLMGYSSISHMGFLLVGMAAMANPAASDSALRGIMIYMVIYLVMTAGVFTVILAMRRNGQMVEQIDDLSGLATSHPGMAAAMAILMFSMAGIPPLAGFFAKFFIFLAAIEAGLVSLTVVAVVASVISAFYYLRIIKLMYFDQLDESLDALKSLSLRTVMMTSAAAMVVAVILLAPLSDAIASAAGSLLR